MTLSPKIFYVICCSSVVLSVLLGRQFLLYASASTMQVKKEPVKNLPSQKYFFNNCLFDATIAFLKNKYGYLYPHGSQHLREQCNKILEGENLPLIPDNMPAGEQYLQALSKFFHSKILVTYGKFCYNIVHSDIAAEKEDEKKLIVIKLTHLGDQDSGHWVPTSSPA
jgi:hypothetical protein